jgi:hypothetical protein
MDRGVLFGHYDNACHMLPRTGAAIYLFSILIMWRVALLTAISLIALIIYQHAYGSLTTLEEHSDADVFWMDKTHALPIYDVVLVGDSRVYRGLAPQAMELEGMAILNFGFSSAGLSKEYLQATVAKLNPQSVNRTVVVGITAFSLSNEINARENRHWLSYRIRPVGRQQSLSEWCRTTVPSWIESPIDRLQWNVQGVALGEVQYHQRFWSNGWVESDTSPRDPTRAINGYKEGFKSPDNRCIPEHVLALSSWIKEQVKSGVRVICFRPPTTEAMDKLENSEGDFHEQGIRESMIAAGALWFEDTRADYESYDGSHLTFESARRFSRNLGIFMGTHLSFQR